MKYCTATLSLLLAFFLVVPQAEATNLNLLNVQMGTPQGNQLAKAYGKAYGFSPQQVAPALMGAPEEVPAVLKIAQAAGTLPLTVFMMRKMGMSYPSILSTFALAPSILGGSAGSLFSPTPYSNPSVTQNPSWTQWMSPLLVQTARMGFLKDILKVPMNFIPQVPTQGLDFTQALLKPSHPVLGTWLPPGIAKKYGLGVPPGQAQKLGWGPWRYQASKNQNDHRVGKGKGKGRGKKVEYNAGDIKIKSRPGKIEIQVPGWN